MYDLKSSYYTIFEFKMVCGKLTHISKKKYFYCQQNLIKNFGSFYKKIKSPDEVLNKKIKFSQKIKNKKFRYAKLSEFDEISLDMKSLDFLVGVVSRFCQKMNYFYIYNKSVLGAKLLVFIYVSVPTITYKKI